MAWCPGELLPISLVFFYLVLAGWRHNLRRTWWQFPQTMQKHNMAVATVFLSTYDPGGVLPDHVKSWSKLPRHIQGLQDPASKAKPGGAVLGWSQESGVFSRSPWRCKGQNSQVIFTLLLPSHWQGARMEVVRSRLELVRVCMTCTQVYSLCHNANSKALIFFFL